MIDFLINIDKELFLFLNGLHANWLDPVMVFISSKLTFAPLYGFLIFLLYKAHGVRGLWFVLGAILTVILVDQLTSGIMKPGFERLRPCHDPTLANLIHQVSGCGGKFGFASGHSANSFAIATFFIVVLDRYRALYGLLVWAAIVAYSRVYLGVHFPGDIIVGGLIGALIGYSVARISYRLWDARN